MDICRIPRPKASPQDLRRPRMQSLLSWPATVTERVTLRVGSSVRMCDPPRAILIDFGTQKGMQETSSAKGGTCFGMAPIPPGRLGGVVSRPSKAAAF